MAQKYQDILAAARETIPEITPQELAAKKDTIIIDVREPNEWEEGVIEGALLIPQGILEHTVEAKVPNTNTPMVIYCGSGQRSLLAGKALQELGYKNIVSLAGGFERWRIEGQNGQHSDSLTRDQRARYARHLSLKNVGEQGQARLLNAKVLVIGAGGLGSPACLYLAAAGIGSIGIMDYDIVETSNLQRQILHSTDQIGKQKVNSAYKRLSGLNPDVKIKPYATRLTSENALDIMENYDVVVDGGDNFPTRYLVNDAALHLKVPIVHGSIFRFEGQATVFDPYNGPCYRCLFPLPPPQELSLNCKETGVLGVVPGVIGSIQATETIKLILGIGDTLNGRLLTYDALDQSFMELSIVRNPKCPSCALEDRPPRLVDYDETCIPVGNVEAL